SLAEMPQRAARLGPLALLACAIGGGLWYAATKSTTLLVGLVIVCAGSAINTMLSYSKARDEADNLRMSLLAYTLVASLLVASWALYFQFLTLGVADHQVARRLVLTLAWAIAGLGALVVGRKRGETPIANAGYVLVVAALAKALFYDTTHLGGGLRVATLGSFGLLLLAAAQALLAVTPARERI